MNLFGEFNCFGLCLKASVLAPFVALLFVISISLWSASFMIKKPKQRLMTFVSSQVAGLLATILTFYLMKCSEMLSIYFYFGYVAVSSALIFGLLRFYDKIMIKRLGAKPIGNIIIWVQGFVDKLTNATVYYYDSAAPRAFAAGRTIFVSIGLLEMLDNDELKAVLAHEAWHIRHNSQTPYLKKLAIMTFSSYKSMELESMADRFAAEIAGIEALAAARNKVDKVFI
jgi:Zn-dependent protease with chaperone function